MEAFIAVVEDGGFTSASRRLGVSKSAVSKHIAALEARLGVRLLERTTRRVSPTDLGLLYYDRARFVLGAASDADQMVAAKMAVPEGVLRLSVADDVAMRFLAGGMSGFLAAHDRLFLEIVPPGPAPGGAAEPDLSVTTVAPGRTPAGEMLAEIPFLLVAAPGYLSEEGRPQRVDDLPQHRLALIQWPDRTPLQLVTRTQELRTVHAPARLMAPDAATVRDAAEAGLGVAFLPDFIAAPGLAAGRLVQVLPDLPEQRAALVVTAAHGDLTEPKTRAFLAHYREAGLAAEGEALLQAGGKSGA